jgi:sigma-B regulation protein RsbU (phosphoserine phosphatase)
MFETLFNIEFLFRPFIAKIFILIAVLFFYNLLEKKQKMKIRAVRSTIVMLMVRDLVFEFINYPNLYPIVILTDLILIIIFFRWLRTFTGPRKNDGLFFVGSFILLIILFLEWILPYLPDLLTYYYRLPILFTAIYFSVQMFQVSSHNTDDPQVIEQIRGPFSTFLISYHGILLFIRDDNPVASYIIVPALYLVLAWMFYQYNNVADRRYVTKTKDLEGDIDSLFDFMRNIGNAITEHLEISRILNYIVSSAVRNTRADAGAIYLIDDFEDILMLKASSGSFPPPYEIPPKVREKAQTMQDYLEVTPIPVGKTILGEVAKTGRAVFIRNTAQDERMVQNTHNNLQFISSIMIMPLIVSNKVLGVLSIVKKTNFALFDENDYTNLRSFADYTSLSLDNLLTYLELLEKKEMEREVGIAADIQTKLLPRRLPVIQGLKVAAFSKPARGVSGDYYDVMKVKRGKMAMVICDVAGKGVPASLVMIMIRSILHLIAGAQKDAKTIVNWINRGITGKIDIDHFATLSFLTFDPVSGVVEYSNAGHHPMMIYRAAQDKIEILDTEGLPIGIESAADFHMKTTVLKDGDIAVLYTDGIIEAMNQEGDQYSYERLVELVSAQKTLDPEALIESIKHDISEFVGYAKQHDDQTLLVFKKV